MQRWHKTQIIIIDANKVFNQIKHAFMTKTLNKMRIQETFLKIMKVIYYKPKAKIILNGEKIKDRAQDEATHSHYFYSK